MSGLFGELKRRNVIKVAIAYLVAAWLVAQIVIAVESPLHLPGWADTLVIVLLAIGFPFALIVAWSFERSPEGLKRSARSETREESAPEATEHTAASPPADEGRPSIAVLPFVDMSPDKDQEYFSDGIAEELLNQLAKVPDLHVAGRTSSFSFKGKDEDLRLIGQKLGVANILEGSVRKAGNRVRVTAQLIKAADGYHLWSESYDRELDDIFGIQDEIAHAVTDALSITLGVGNLGVTTRNVEAYDAYLEGKAGYHRGGREDWLHAIDRLERATRLDPGFAEAWSWLATVYYYGGRVMIADRLEELHGKFEGAAQRAIDIAPDSVSTLYVSALQESRDFNWAAAERLLAMALERAPNDPQSFNYMGSLLLDVGRIREGLGYMQQMRALEPLSMMASSMVAITLDFAGDLEDSAREFERAANLEGDIAGIAGPALAVALTRGDRAEIERTAARAFEYDLLPAGSHGLNRTMHGLLDEPESALRTLRKFARDPAYDTPITHNVLAFYASHFGDDELALELFRPLLLSGSFIVRPIWRPMHRNMRHLPGFKDLLRELKLVDYWRATGKWGDYVRPVGEDDFECI